MQDPFSGETGLDRVPEVVPSEPLADASAVDRENPAEVGLDERSDRVSAKLSGKNARGGSDSSLPTQSRRARAGADASFGHRSFLRRFNGRDDVFGGHPSRADVVQAAIVGLPDNRVDRTHAFIARLRQRPSGHRVHGDANGERVRQNDRRLDVAELANLKEPGRLAEPVADVHGSRDFLLEEVAAMRKNGRHAGSDRVPFDESLVADANARDVGDRIPLSRREDARRDAEIADAGTLLSDDVAGQKHADAQKQKGVNEPGREPAIGNRKSNRGSAFASIPDSRFPISELHFGCSYSIS
jgi:hypothetical protein